MAYPNSPAGAAPGGPRPGAIGSPRGEVAGSPAGEVAAGEVAAVAALLRRLPGAPPGERWAGDDAAAVLVEPGTLLLTVDTAVLGVHADPAVLTPADLGWRAVAGAVSDVAAMGGEARHLLVAVAGPPDTDLDGIYDGVLAAAACHGTGVVGGDLSSAPCLSVAVSVTGWVPAGEPGPVGRDGAQPGDVLFVTGPLGASAAGLRLLRARAAGELQWQADSPEAAAVATHARPVARLAAGAVGRRAGVTAMLDLSDGLGLDLGRLAEASGVGFALQDVPVAAAATRAEALGGGEDYELLLAAPDAESLLAAFAAAGLPAPHPIGRCVADTTVRTLAGRPLPPTGWDHRWGQSPGTGPPGLPPR